MYLSNVPSEGQIESWGLVFPYLIDRVFGAKALSLRFFFRSCIASLLALLIVTPLYFVIVGSRVAGGSLWTVLNLVVLLSPFVNFVPDYLSLLITRAIVSLLAKRPTIKRALILFVVDFVLTAMVADLSVYFLLIMFVATIGLFTHPIPLSGFFTLRGVASFMMLLFKGRFYRILFSVFIFSAFFTSTWLWLYLISIGLIREMQRARNLWLKVLPFLDIEKKPVVAIGKVAGLLAGAVFAIMIGINWLLCLWR